MADPIDLSMVVSSALPATFTFLYERLGALLANHRTDRSKGQPECLPKTPAVLIGELELPLHADEVRVRARLAELRAYELGLALYSSEPAAISSEDALLLRTLGDLRYALEDIYGQRFTFEGEARGRSGPYSEQRHGEVAGEVVGIEATNTINGPVTSKITTDSVKPGGRVVGMRARDIGSARVTDSP